MFTAHHIDDGIERLAFRSSGGDFAPAVLAIIEDGRRAEAENPRRLSRRADRMDDPAA